MKNSKVAEGQINLFDLFFPKPKSKNYIESIREEEDMFDSKIQNFTFDEKLIARTRPWLIYYADNLCYENENLIDTFKEIKEIAATRRDIFVTEKGTIWSYDKWSEKWEPEKREYRGYVGKQLAFRLGEEVIAMKFAVENIYKDAICFPACEMAYMDRDGNRLPFTIRDKFIEEGLGLLEHGEYRLGKITKDAHFSFASMKTTLGKIIRHLKLKEGQ